MRALTLDEIVDAFNFFNERLFGGELPPVFLRSDIITDECANFALYRPAQFNGLLPPEIVFDLEHLMTASPGDVLQALAHEMTHHWRESHGPRPTKFHDAEWSRQMISTGLEPVRHGANRWGDEVVQGGPFERARDAYLATLARARQKGTEARW